MDIGPVVPPPRSGRSGDRGPGGAEGAAPTGVSGIWVRVDPQPGLLIRFGSDGSLAVDEDGRYFTSNPAVLGTFELDDEGTMTFPIAGGPGAGRGTPLRGRQPPPRPDSCRSYTSDKPQAIAA
jgi:hypothetical protein